LSQILVRLIPLFDDAVHLGTGRIVRYPCSTPPTQKPSVETSRDRRGTRPSVQSA
jgi:hypothetical protein